MQKNLAFSVESAVTKEDREPLVVLTIEGKKVLFSIAQARKIAADIVQQAARSEADAMIFKFFNDSKYPVGAANALMFEFRLFRHKLDTEPIESTVVTPSFDPKPH